MRRKEVEKGTTQGRGRLVKGAGPKASKEALR